MRIEKDRSDNKDYFTLGIVKPDAMDHIEEIIDKINDYGLKIFHFKYLIFTEELIDEHYAHVKKFNEEIFNNLKSELKDKLVLVFMLYDKKGNAIKSYREILGATNPNDDAYFTIRGTFGDKVNTHRNSAHGSGNRKEAEEETIRFFKDELFDVFDNLAWLIKYEEDASIGHLSEGFKDDVINTYVKRLIMFNNPNKKEIK